MNSDPRTTTRRKFNTPGMDGGREGGRDRSTDRQEAVRSSRKIPSATQLDIRLFKAQKLKTRPKQAPLCPTNEVRNKTPNNCTGNKYHSLLLFATSNEQFSLPTHHVSSLGPFVSRLLALWFVSRCNPERRLRISQVRELPVRLHIGLQFGLQFEVQFEVQLRGVACQEDLEAGDC